METTIRNNEHLDPTHSHVCNNRCISWSAVFMGALVAIAFSFLLNLLCLGIGISAFPSTENGQLTFAVGGFVALVICSILAMFPAGYVAGKLGRTHCTKPKAGECYGLAAWTIALIVSILLGASMGNFVKQATYAVTRKPVEIRLANLNNDQVFVTNQNRNTNEPVKVDIDPDKAADATAMAIFATFAIFFIGMLAACFGGRCGMMCHQRELENCNTTDHCHKA